MASGIQVGADIIPADQTNTGVNTGATPQLITGSESSALVWNLDVDSWPALACRTAGGDLTRAEWEQWRPRDEAYRAICEQYPIEE